MAHNARHHEPPRRPRRSGGETWKKRPRHRALPRINRAAPQAEQQHGSGCVENPLRDQMIALLPNLRAFAVSLTNDPVRADDLVQDTILRARAKINQFERGTNLAAWLFTILRNSFYTEHRKRKREVEDPDGAYAGRLIALPTQEAGLEMAEFRSALARLPFRQREALLLVGAEGLTYEDAAVIQGIAIGTVKSRVNRARSHLAHLLQLGDDDGIGPDRIMKAVLQPPVRVL